MFKNKAGWKLHTIVSWTANLITLPLKHQVRWEPERQSRTCHGLKMSMHSLHSSFQAALARPWLSAPLSTWTAGVTQKGWLENNSTEMPDLYIDYLRDSWKYWKKHRTERQRTWAQFLAQPRTGSRTLVPWPPWASVFALKIRCLLPFLPAPMFHDSSSTSASWVSWGFLQTCLHACEPHCPAIVEWRDAGKESTY